MLHQEKLAWYPTIACENLVQGDPAREKQTCVNVNSDQEDVISTSLEANDGTNTGQNIQETETLQQKMELMAGESVTV